jgi:hypothetical protein
MDRFFGFDERFVMHRYRSTRLAAVVGVILIVVWFNYEFLVNHTLRLDLAVIAVVMALTKVGAMVYYRLTH